MQQHFCKFLPRGVDLWITVSRRSASLYSPNVSLIRTTHTHTHVQLTLIWTNVTCQHLVLVPAASCFRNKPRRGSVSQLLQLLQINVLVSGSWQTFSVNQLQERVVDSKELLDLWTPVWSPFGSYCSELSRLSVDAVALWFLWLFCCSHYVSLWTSIIS